MSLLCSMPNLWHFRRQAEQASSIFQCNWDRQSHHQHQLRLSGGCSISGWNCCRSWGSSHSFSRVKACRYWNELVQWHRQLASAPALLCEDSVLSGFSGNEAIHMFGGFPVYIVWGVAAQFGHRLSSLSHPFQGVPEGPHGDVLTVAQHRPQLFILTNLIFLIRILRKTQLFPFYQGENQPRHRKVTGGDKTG